jgi:hypothetical protein
VPGNSAWVCPEFQAVDSNNTLIGVGSIELVSVTNGNGATISPTPFELVNTTGFKYRLRAIQYFYWGQDSNNRTFNITLRILANGDNLVTKQLLLSNVKPSLNPVPSQGIFQWTLGQNGSNIIYPIHISPPSSSALIQIGDVLGTIDLTTQAFNGSAGANLDNLEVVVNRSTNTITAQFFRLNQDVNNNTITLTTDDDPLAYNSNIPRDTVIILKIVVKDAQGISGSDETYYSAKIEITD